MVSNAQMHPLMPIPQKIGYGDGKFLLSNAVIILPKEFSSEDKKAIHEFISFVKQRTGVALAIKNGGAISASSLVFKNNNKGSALPTPHDVIGSQSREAYQIKVSPKKITVTGNSSAGIYYALQTLRQLVVAENKNSFIPEVDIDDYPSLSYRGIMMDVAHGGLPTEEEIKKQIDFLSKWKMNQYYLYSEVSIELQGYPLLNYNANYSREEIKRIIDYAKERHIDVIPFIELYGHLHELLRIEKYSKLAIGKYGHELDPRNPAVKELMKDWLKQYAELFPSPFFHIGFDETWETVRMSLDTDTTLKPDKLYLDQLDFVTSALEGYGKKVMLWTDITETYPKILSQFPKKVIPVVWEYSSDTAAMNNWIRPVVKEHFPFFIQSAVDNWQDLYTDENYTYNNIDLCIKSAKDNNAIGYITSVWSDAVQTLQRNSWMFMAYGSIAAWQHQRINRNEFISNYSQIEYPGISTLMDKAFNKLAESQTYLEKATGQRHTLTGMWADPFSSAALKNTNAHVDDYEKTRLAAETAAESFINALQNKSGDSNMIKTLLVNSRLLEYAATRFLWAKNIVDRWDNYIAAKGKKDSWVMYYDIDYSAHGFITDMEDYCAELKEEYRRAWLSENKPYRLGTMLGRFDSEYSFWRNLYLKVRDYEDHNKIDKQPKKFEELFGTEH
jgi:hexosaminidase